MKATPKNRQLAKLSSDLVKPVPVMPPTVTELARLNRTRPAAQQRMQAKQSGETGANHARHHVSRQTQS